MHDSAAFGRYDPCHAFRDAIDAVAAAEADAISTARLEDHAAFCPQCANRLHSLRAFHARLRRVGAAERAPARMREMAESLLREARGSLTR